MSNKTPQQLASEYKRDSATMRAGFIKAMNLIKDAENVPENVKQLANECIHIISGVSDYNSKTTAMASEPELPKPKDPTVEPKPAIPPPDVPEQPKPPIQPKPPTDANRRFRR